MARPRGSKSYKSKSIRLLLGRLEGEGRLTPTRILEKLQEIALSDAPDRIAAARLLLGYFYGYPQARIELEHGVSQDAIAILLRIHESDSHRRHLEELDLRRRRLTAVTIEPEREPAAHGDTGPTAA